MKDPLPCKSYTVCVGAAWKLPNTWGVAALDMLCLFRSAQRMCRHCALTVKTASKTVRCSNKLFSDLRLHRVLLLCACPVRHQNIGVSFDATPLLHTLAVAVCWTALHARHHH